MTDPGRFDASAPLETGRTVIEASAGTGKTYAIAAAVARLVADEGLDIEDILVVTFTVAATAELKKRVRRRLVDTLRALTTRVGVADDEAMRKLADVPADERTRRAERVRVALNRFDRAQIFTIHGFAQRLLGQLGFRSRLPADLDSGTVDDTLLAEVVSDVVLGHVAAGGDGDLPGSRQLAQLARVVLQTPDARIVPDVDEVDGVARRRVELGGAIAAETRRRMRRSGRVTFDDGLFEVRDALADPVVGAAAGEVLRRRYEIALVDEAQDTDPVQWEVISRVFDGQRLVVIGDPKQSIYGFRAADVESYIAARREAGALHTLGTNWRSDGPLVNALNRLFDGATFGADEISYRRVVAAPDHASARIHGAGAPLTIRSVAGDLDIPRHRTGYRVQTLRPVVAADVAEEVVRLLSSGITIDGDAGPDRTRPLGPGDIAVLCRTGAQIDEVRRALGIRRVPAVASRGDGVFMSPVAEDWRRFLLALERPDRVPLVRLAATTRLLGYSLEDVARFTDDEVLDLQHDIAGWHRCLLGGGVPEVVAELDRHTGLAARILAGPDGERTMTDFTHIAEELHAAWRRGRVTSLAAWLEKAMAEAGSRAESKAEEPEERQRRLETDAAAVKVLTVHRAKGLEFPVVLVPFAWDEWINDPPVPVFHDPAGTAGGGPRRRLVDIAGKDGHAGFAAHAALAKEEDRAEESRLLYVALTRPHHHLQVWWIEAHSTADGSTWGEVLTADGTRTLDDLVGSAGGDIAATRVDAIPAVTVYSPPSPSGAALDRARFARPLDHTWQRASFSSLSPEHPLVPPEETTEEAERLDESVADELAVPPVPGSGLLMAELPRGARFGTLVHDVFEHTRFDSPDLAGEVRRAVDAAMAGGAWDFDPGHLATGLVAAATTPLGPEPGDVRLSDLAAGAVLDELFFELPVRTTGPAITLRDVAAVMLDHLPADDPYRRYAAELAGVDPRWFRGFLTGAIDVTAAVPGAESTRYVVMDYKSNALRAAGREASPLDYGPGPLAAAMIDGDYVLQATLYQVALHRYLQWRLPGYDPACHLGGALYLFVRGMVGPGTPVVDGERCGVVRWRPPAAMVEALSHLFAGVER